MSNYQNVLALIARVLFTLIFILAGYNKIVGFSNTVTMLGSMNLPMPTVLTVLAIICELGGGLLLLLGYKARLGALLLLIFIVVVSPIFHDFWNHVGSEQMNQWAHFFKNLSLIGAAFGFCAMGAGKYSFDHCCSKS